MVRDRDRPQKGEEKERNALSPPLPLPLAPLPPHPPAARRSRPAERARPARVPESSYILCSHIDRESRPPRFAGRVIRHAPGGRLTPFARGAGAAAPFFAPSRALALDPRFTSFRPAPHPLSSSFADPNSVSNTTHLPPFPPEENTETDNRHNKAKRQRRLPPPHPVEARESAPPLILSQTFSITPFPLSQRGDDNLRGCL